jgi:hypothetical protein
MVTTVVAVPPKESVAVTVITSVALAKLEGNALRSVIWPLLCTWKRLLADPAKVTLAPADDVAVTVATT